MEIGKKLADRYSSMGEVADRNVLDPVHEREISDLVDPLGVGDAKDGLQAALGEQVMPPDALLEGDSWVEPGPHGVVDSRTSASRMFSAAI